MELEHRKLVWVREFHADRREAGKIIPCPIVTSRSGFQNSEGCFLECLVQQLPILRSSLIIPVLFQEYILCVTLCLPTSPDISVPQARELSLVIWIGVLGGVKDVSRFYFHRWSFIVYGVYLPFRGQPIFLFCCCRWLLLAVVGRSSLLLYYCQQAGFLAGTHLYKSPG